MVSPLLELYFAKSNAVSPLCREAGRGEEGRGAMGGGAVTAGFPAPPTHGCPPPPPTLVSPPPPLRAAPWRTLSLRLVSAPALMSDLAQSVCSLVTAQCSAVHMDCRETRRRRPHTRGEQQLVLEAAAAAGAGAAAVANVVSECGVRGAQWSER
jgi:hypothetical protein